MSPRLKRQQLRRRSHKVFGAHMSAINNYIKVKMRWRFLPSTVTRERDHLPAYHALAFPD